MFDLADLEELDEVIGKVGELKGEVITLKEAMENEEYLTAKDVAKKMGCSVEAARAYMARPDFPKLKIGNGYRVSATKFFLYNMEART